MSPHGRSRDGLFWNPSGTAEVQDNPLTRPCPACGGQPRERCTRTIPGGRHVELRHHFHHTRRHPRQEN